MSIVVMICHGASKPMGLDAWILQCPESSALASVQPPTVHLGLGHCGSTGSDQVPGESHPSLENHGRGATGSDRPFRASRACGNVTSTRREANVAGAPHVGMDWFIWFGVGGNRR